jgi:hypothetical protein
MLHHRTKALAQLVDEPEGDVKAKIVDSFKMGLPASTFIEHPEIYKRLVGKYGTKMESNPLSAFWDGMVGEARNSEQAELLGGYIKKLAAGPLSPEDGQRLKADVENYQRQQAIQQSVEPDGFLAYIGKNAGELLGQQIPGIWEGVKKYGPPLLGAGLALALAVPTGGLSVAGGSALAGALAGTAAVTTPGLVGAAATGGATGGAYEDMLNREALETFLELMRDPKNQTPEGQVRAARLAMAKGAINAYIELGTLGNIGRMLNVPGLKSIGLLPEKIKSAFTRFLGSPEALRSPTAANFLKSYAGTFIRNVSSESFEEVEQAFVGDAFVNFSRHLNGDLSLAEAMGNLFSRDELRSLGLVYGQSAESFAAGMLPGGLARAGAGLLGLRAYNKSPQGKLHKALVERRELEGGGDVVFLPREVLQSFGQSEVPAGGEGHDAQGIEKTLGVTDADVVKSTKEVMVDRKKYEQVAREDPAFRAAAEAYVRYGSEGRTFSETAAEIRDNVSDPINADTPFARSARAVRDRKIQALKDAGADDRTAEAGGYIWAKSVLRRAYNLGENEFGVLRDDALTPEELDKLEVRGGQAGENAGDVYGQPMNAGVDLNQEIQGVVVQSRLTADEARGLKRNANKKDFARRLAGDYINRDTGWTLHLSLTNVSHAISSALTGVDVVIPFEKSMQILEGLPELLANAKLVESHKDRKGRQNIQNIHRFYASARLSDDSQTTYTVKITVKELAGKLQAQIDKIYESHDARVIKKVSGVSPAPQGLNRDLVKQNAPDTYSIILRDVLDNVKDNDGNLYFQPGERAPLVRAGLTRKPDSAQAKVIRLPENAVPQFPKVQDFNKWVKALLMNDGNLPVKIISTGQKATFTGRNIRSSLKRARSEAHREAYAALREMISLAEYDHFEPADVKHLHLRGQDVYYSALSVGDQLYSVRLKLDVSKDRADVVYKDHRLTEIEIAPALYQGSSKNGLPLQEAGAVKMAPALYSTEFGESQSRTQEADAISTVSLGVLRGNVKPSHLENGALWQEQLRGSVEFRGDKSLITLFKAADQSTFVHEMGHVMLENLLRLGRGDDAPPMVAKDLDVALDFLNMKDFDFDHVETPVQRKRLTDAQERFARAFERYLMEGRAPSKGLKRVFARMKRWMLSIYHNVRRLDVELSPQVRDLFARLLAGPVAEEGGWMTLADLHDDAAATKACLAELNATGSEKLPRGERRKAFYAGKKLGVELQKERALALKERQRDRACLKKEVDTLVRGIASAGEQKSIIWSAKQEIQDVLKGYTLKNPSRQRLARAQELRLKFD